MRKCILLIGLVGLIFLNGCSGVEKGALEITTTEGLTEMTLASEEAVQLQDAWVTVVELSVDMDGDQIEDIVTVEEQSALEGYIAYPD